MAMPDFEAAITHALDRLRDELPPTLLYHDAGHTREDVLPAAERLAVLSGVEGEDLQLLRVATAYHDLGYIFAYWQHELASLRLAAQTLPQFDLLPEQIERVLGMIVATRMPQSPRDLLEQILADADLDSLGRPDFLELGLRLRQELELHGQPRPLRHWEEGQLAFLKQHAFFTEAARRLRDSAKQANIAVLEAKLRGDWH
jgi:predicted metal-dependent HD superfamily phosphohydrolase